MALSDIKSDTHSTLISVVFFFYELLSFLSECNVTGLVLRLK